MSGEQPAKDTSAPGGSTKRGTLRTRDVTGLACWPATGKHRVINSCRLGHSETIEVTTQAGWIAAMTAPCSVVMPDGRACVALVNVSTHVGPDGREIGMILILDPKTEKAAPGEPADER